MLVAIRLCYASEMRPREIPALNVEDIQRKPTGVLIGVRRSKTDPAAASPSAWPCGGSSTQPFDPMPSSMQRDLIESVAPVPR